MNNNYSKKILLTLLFCALTIFCPLKQAAQGGISQPKLLIKSSVSDINGGLSVANDIIEYTFNITNNGDDTATLVVLEDSIPTNTTYVSGSMRIDSFAKSDGALNDEAEYSAFNRQVTFRLGTLATFLAGGSLPPNASTVVKFRVRINTGVPTGTAISNQASTSYSGIVIVDNRTALSDSNLDAAGSQVSTFFVNAAPPNIQLTHSVSPAGMRPPKTDLTFTSIFTNSGGSQAQNFAITEPIPGNTYFKINSATTNLNTTGLSVAIQYSNDNGSTFNYIPTSGGGNAQSGYDGKVTHIRFVFTGLLNYTTPNNAGAATFSAQIQ